MKKPETPLNEEERLRSLRDYEILDTAPEGPASRGFSILPVRPYLFLVLECDRPSAGGARYALSSVGSVVIGRGGARHAEVLKEPVPRLSIRVPARTMSSEHARIRWTQAGWTLDDLRSKNGSYVNGRRIESAPVGDGDIIELGHTIFEIRVAVPTPQGTASIFDTSESSPSPQGLQTLNPMMADALQQLARVSSSVLPVSLSGPSGTGKDILARAVHKLSRRQGPFVGVNCGAIPPNLIESTLFGHKKGAFSGATNDAPGLVQASHGGTLFLDELAELSPSAQVALLRVLQDKEVHPVGASHPAKVDLRVVTATHEPLAKLVAQGKFRGDLQARLQGYSFALPALSSRREDLGVLIAALMHQPGTGVEAIRSFGGSAGRRLFEYGWPLNIRELRQVLARASVLSSDGCVMREHLPPEIAGPGAGETGRDDTKSCAIAVDNSAEDTDHLLRQEVEQMLAKYEGNVSAVARTMGKERAQVHRWIRRFAIDVEQYRK